MAILTELSRNVHKVNIHGSGPHRFMLMSDLHWDNPHCQRDLLKEHLDYALENQIPVLLNGDTFCLMQGKYDPRRSKDNIRPEHNVSNYLDAVIQDAVEWFKPYASIIAFAGYGNHETSIIRNCETDPLRRWADLMNATTPYNLHIGGYGGWLVFSQTRPGSTGSLAWRLKYFHGAGGGGPVTRGVIQNQRMMAAIDGADGTWMGHVHEMYTMVNAVERLDSKNNVVMRDVTHIRTPTYKEEYGDGYMDFHVERGRPPKPVGCYELVLTPTKDRTRLVAQTLQHR